MDREPLSRRGAIRAGAQLTAVGTAMWALAACGEQSQALVCADPNKLSVAENSLRKANNYSEKSPDPAKTCSGCGFMPPLAAGATCGKCEIFIGPVNPAGYCDSFSARQA
ncbi:MAG: hypothetical protein SFV21_01090 [Rhodospirillaceae bacterium]|nr:hypothetical protein [Rhodospirillaceae bacterium]